MNGQRLFGVKKRKICKKHTEGNGKQQQRFKSPAYGKIDKHTGHNKHGEVFPTVPREIAYHGSDTRFGIKLF